MMKRKFLVYGLLLLILFPALPAAARKSPWDVKLPFREAEIDYQLAGTEKGIEKLYLRDYGRERARYRKTKGKILFKHYDVETLEITTPDWVYRLDLRRKKGTKAVNPVKYMRQEFSRLSRSEQKKVMHNAQEMGLYLMQAMDGKIEKKATKILGYQCDRVSMKMATVYTMSGYDIVLKSESNVAGIKTRMTAQKIKKGPVPAKFFTPPAGIAITHDPEADRASRKMAKEVIAMLLDPEAARKKLAADNSHGSAPAREDNGREAAKEEDDGNQLDKAMKQGMKALKGLFGGD